ncbi:MAG: DUF4159 domain-containing protein [Rhizobiales bacterium]|nr:DUF4159 domain-containing protein [Hyphomicrobiales bacterium]
MFGTALAFTSPAILGALLLLPLIWWLLRLMPPRPRLQAFPPTRLLAELAHREETPHASPWWLTAIRLLLAALAILALAGPSIRPNQGAVANKNPLIVVLDNGWTTANDWPRRRDAARTLLEDASRAQKPAALIFTTDPENAAIRFDDPETMLERLNAVRPLPFPEDRGTTAKRLSAFAKDAGETAANTEIVWIASPLRTDGDAALADQLSAMGAIRFRFNPDARLAISEVGNSANALDVVVKRLAPTTRPVTLRALDKDGLALAEVAVPFAGDALETKAVIELPIELRNEIIRLALMDENGAILESVGGHYLLDDRSRRRSVGLLSGASVDQAQQPLLSPLYYIRRALEPFADLRDAGTQNIAEAVPSLIRSGASMIVMADVGTLPANEVERLRRFMTQGGTVVRFSGPRLAATRDALTPVRLRAGERSLGGSLTWEKPQKLARFSENGPFAGMNLPGDIEVTRQVLAEPDFDLLNRTWAELEDGTPLVTAQKVGEGWLILFHVTADASWSNLPISGAFVDMLVKLVAFSSVPASAVTGNTNSVAEVFPPFQTLDAYGRLGPPIETAEPIALSALAENLASSKTPPGLYGKEESLIALNLMTKQTPFAMLDPAALAGSASITGLDGQIATDLRPSFFSGAVILLLIDAVIVAAMAGLFSGALRARFRALAGCLIAGCLLVFGAPTQSRAQGNSDEAYAGALTTRLAYVMTGDSAVDEISAAGLKGLSTFLALRTALEPGAPVGVDIAKDEMAFYALLYWPITPNAPVPDAATMARVDAFMKQGGTVLFDTRDQFDTFPNTVTPATAKLRQIVAGLDIPPLEPVPSNHVLTRSFYLLQDFPGRWDGSPLWVEATSDKEKNDEESQTEADGVSSILITANDLAGAWATDASNQPLLPTVPSDPEQRVYAFRTGVNIVMYTLTGNYKADQVHVPALLERLGQ